MSTSVVLQDLVDACVAPLSAAGPGGRDLASLNIVSDVSARHRHEIVQAFQDSRNADWSKLHEAGLGILREQSKDVYALWAALTPLPVVQGRGFVGLATSLEVCNRYLADLWDHLFPALPDGMNVRSAVFTQLVRRWTGFLKKSTVQPSDAAALHQAVALLAEFERLIAERLPDALRPQMSELRQLLNALASNFPDPSAAAAAAETAAAATQSPAELAGAEPALSAAAPTLAAGDAVDGIRATYVQALRAVSARPQESIQQMTQSVERQSTLAGRFRGRVFLGDLYLRAGYTKLARQLLEFLDEESGNVKLEDWEPELCGQLWATLYQALAREHEGKDGGPPKDVKERLEKLFARVCRVDAKQALGLKTD